MSSMWRERSGAYIQAAQPLQTLIGPPWLQSPYLIFSPAKPPTNISADAGLWLRPSRCLLLKRNITEIRVGPCPFSHCIHFSEALIKILRQLFQVSQSQHPLSNHFFSPSPSLSPHVRVPPELPLSHSWLTLLIHWKTVFFLSLWGRWWMTELMCCRTSELNQLIGNVREKNKASRKST